MAAIKVLSACLFRLSLLLVLIWNYNVDARGTASFGGRGIHRKGPSGEICLNIRNSSRTFDY